MEKLVLKFKLIFFFFVCLKDFIKLKFNLLKFIVCIIMFIDYIGFLYFF